MTIVRFVDQPDGWTRVSFPYDPVCVSIVKDVGPGSRTYDPKTKTWSVLTEMAETLAEAFIVAGHDIVGETIEAKSPPTIDEFFSPEGARSADATQDGFDPKQVAVDFIATLPGQHVGKVFRAMAKLLYPDLYSRKR